MVRKIRESMRRGPICKISSYYSTGLNIELSRCILYNIFTNKDYNECQGRYRNEIKENLEMLSALGFLKRGRFGSITPKGIALIMIKIFEKNYWDLKDETRGTITRLILLKAMLEADRECFIRFIELKYLRGSKNDEIGKSLFPKDSNRNLIHRIGFHSKMASIIGADRVKECFNESVFAMKGGEGLRTNLEEIIDPYSPSFCRRVIGVPEIHPPPKIPDFNDVFANAISIYSSTLSRPSILGYSEVLKTIIQILSLNEFGVFLSDLEVSRLVVGKISDLGIKLLQSSRGAFLVGKGFVKYLPNAKLYEYPYFRLVH